MHARPSDFPAMVQYDARGEINQSYFLIHLTRSMAGHRNEKEEGKGGRSEQGKKK